MPGCGTIKVILFWGSYQRNNLQKKSNNNNLYFEFVDLAFDRVLEIEILGVALEPMALPAR